jgi:phospholipid/cholesterol/gamma-HCH transport system substrate-binding protein
MNLKRLAVAVVAASFALTGCGFHGLYSATLPGGANVGSHPYSVTIEFADVLDLVPQSSVKVNDVPVGRVESISLDGWVAKVKVTVNGSVKLPANARAAVQMTSLLGEKYVALEQPLGAAVGQLTNGANIPITSTGTAPEVEEVLGALSLLLNGGGLQQIQTITTELNKALNGNEAQVRELLGTLNTFVGGLDSQKTKITNALVSLDKLSATLNQQKQTIIATLDTFPQALEILKNDRNQIVSLLQSFSNLGNVATNVINATQTGLVSSLKALSPVLESLTATGSNLTDALKIAGTFPFPLGATEQLVKGDYANLSLYLDLNLTDALCGLGGTGSTLCTVASAIAPVGTTPASGSATTLTPQSADATPASPLPAFPGAGG